ncbi:hypothetical protein C7B62_15185 [Pleurocapsa sp. CCALA 161]|uniref:DUF3137 domain-containing protein n=1 Tax=Pleurocapsa sp. CCALA 161 TaxID=2107688 RepID=UPI000D07F341|nr:DUF3137 domain-containing protein [Pleurocapsa sp. CCALA 161]PSB08848.1 hypothetical protein C7B62_15185 [Pleurocapsa sp. CCALA 161]
MDKPLSLLEIDRLYLQGDRNLQQQKFPAAIAIFEQLLEIVDPRSRLYFDVQRSLIKAYQQNQELDKAIALCQSVAKSDIASTALWGQHFLAVLSTDFLIPIDNQQEFADEVVPTPAIKPKTLSEFKQYCKAHLLEELQALEHKRKYTLKTIFASGIFCLIITWCFCWALSMCLSGNISVFFYLLCLLFTLPVWIIFCRGCIYNYKIGFKGNIIEKIVDFIGDQTHSSTMHSESFRATPADTFRDRHSLNYAAHLFLENKRQTILALTRSQILNDELQEPDYLEQEDCVYGTIGNTSIFFAEILAEKRTGGYLDEFARETYSSKSVLFQGLFFEAKFAKNFVSRTFVMPNDLKGKMAPLHSWRGEPIKLEDPEFERLFRVYGDSQLESRYILSTNLMARLVEFNQKARRKVYLSFVDGFLYIAIPYRHNLFEPRLFKSMMSFTPLKEYFQDFQLMIGIVEDLNLNRRIWGQ